jgi:type I restriction enzyme, R subunit
MLRRTSFDPLRRALVEQVHQLEAKGAVPDVAQQMVLILDPR